MRAGRTLIVFMVCLNMAKWRKSHEEMRHGGVQERRVRRLRISMLKFGEAPERTKEANREVA